MNFTARTLVAVRAVRAVRVFSAVTATALVLGLAAAPAPALAGRHGGGHGGGWHSSPGWRGGPVWGGVGLGIGIGLGAYYGGLWYPAYPSYPAGYVVVESPPAVVYTPQPAAAAAPARSSTPDPVIYPRNGQSAAQTEADRQECNRWAATQQAALADSSVFLRAAAACMDGRGYTLR